MSTYAKDLLMLRAMPQGALVQHLLRAIAQALIEPGCVAWRRA